VVKQIDCTKVIEAVEKLCMEANYDLGQDVMQSFRKAKATESSPLGQEVLDLLIENAEVARLEKVPMCQDTGIAVLFVEIGQDLRVVGGSLTDALNEGVRRGYEKGYLRKSVVNDPLERVNTKDNTPAVIHYDIVPGEQLKIIIAPKGAGSENMSALKMCKPSEGLDGVIGFVLDTVNNAGGNPCPPIVVGVGIGGTMEKATILAKRGLLRNIGERNRDERLAKIELDILDKINKTGIGPAGFGGITTALDVHIETYPTHIAMMPVAVNINCHAARHKEIIL